MGYIIINTQNNNNNYYSRGLTKLSKIVGVDPKTLKKYVNTDKECNGYKVYTGTRLRNK